MSATALMRHFQAIALLIEQDDSYEGSIEYHASDEPGMFDVTGVYRYGNRDGQGGVILIRGE